MPKFIAEPKMAKELPTTDIWISVRIRHKFKNQLHCYMKTIDTSTLIAKLKKYRILLLIIGLALLSLSQQSFIMPFIYDVIKSDLFLVDTKDKGSELPISTPLSDIAFKHCNDYIKAKAEPDVTFSFPEKPLKAWDSGNYQYLINAEINMSSNNSGSVSKKYSCQITYNKGDSGAESETDAMNIDNWTIYGVQQY
jgi:hypothetical protein